MIDHCPRASAWSLHHKEPAPIDGKNPRRLDEQIHAVVDGNGLPARLAPSPGEAHDDRLAGKLLSRLKSGSMLLADRAYDADWIRELAMKKGAWGQHPAEKQLQRSDLLQPLSLSCSQPGRAVLQQDQTMSSGGDALRQARRQLPRIRSTCVDQAMAAP